MVRSDKAEPPSAHLVDLNAMTDKRSWVQRAGAYLSVCAIRQGGARDTTYALLGEVVGGVASCEKQKKW